MHAHDALERKSWAKVQLLRQMLYMSADINYRHALQGFTLFQLAKLGSGLPLLHRLCQAQPLAQSH